MHTDAVTAVFSGDQADIPLAAGLGVIHVMLALQACRMQELQHHGGFHTDFNGKPGKLDTVQ